MNSSLDLLESIVEVGLHPEKFSDVCHNWAEQRADRDTFKNFETLLNTIYLQNSKQFETLDSSKFTKDPFSNEDIDQTSLILSDDLEVMSIGIKASDMLGLSVGDKHETLFDVPLSDIIESINKSPSKRFFGDILGQDGSRHMASVSQLSLRSGDKAYFRFTLWKLELPVEAEIYIRETLYLTNAEIDILRLVLQRFSLTAISNHRRSSVNTVRTHVSNIKKKFKSNSLTDVISSTHEIIEVHHKSNNGSIAPRNTYVPIQRNSILSKLPAAPYHVEYSRYGDPDNRPLIILHSIEYGISPPKPFLEAAFERGYCVYVPLRPGFGRTTISNSIKHSAVILDEFMKSLKLDDVTIIALSTAGPTMLKLLDASNRISQSVFVNYGFNTEDKISHIKPIWLRGLLDFGMGSSESFGFAFRMTKGMLKILGYKTFYKRLYQSCQEDLDFLEQNDATFKATGNLVLSAKPEAYRSDLVSAFLPIPEMDFTILNTVNVSSIFGEHTHGIDIDPIRKTTLGLGVPFHVISQSGRNCIYQRPATFFKILENQNSLRKAS